MNNKLKAMLNQLPAKPGVYFHKDKTGQIIYVGKAAILKNRVRQYFQASRYRDPKTDLLVGEIADVDWMVVNSEIEALFLEAELIKRYLPKYNILLRDDKSSAYIRINIKDYAPSVTITRRPLDDNANYYGPFLQAGAINKALRLLRKAFPYSTHLTLPNRPCLQFHLGLCPGPETADYSREIYMGNLKKLIQFIEGNSQTVVKKLSSEMKSAAHQQDFETAAIARDKIRSLKRLQTQVIFGDSESLDLSKDQALTDLSELLSVDALRRIEGYDISHLQGTDTVASMVVFANGVPQKTAYRKFKLRVIGNDDYAHINEVILRRLQPKNINLWHRPDLILIDGGKGQLSSAIRARELSSQKIPIIGLAKRYEELIIHQSDSLVTLNPNKLTKLKGSIKNTGTEFDVVTLPPDSLVVKLLQRIRDESHRFAINYHTSLGRNRQTASHLDTIPSIGVVTKKRLLRKFGSLKAIQSATEADLKTIIGPAKAKIIARYFRQEPD